jgi:hypothetical protein
LNTDLTPVDMLDQQKKLCLVKSTLRPQLFSVFEKQITVGH